MRARDPLTAARNKLMSRDGFLDSELTAHEQEIEKQIANLLARVRSDAPPDISSAGAGVFVDVQHD
jgi:TPP-dependent pyruvate/acetoin dehydrogenase alpha subunit